MEELSIITITLLKSKNSFLFNHLFSSLQSIENISEFDVLFISRQSQFPLDQIAIIQFNDPTKVEFFASYSFPFKLQK